MSKTNQKLSRKTVIDALSPCSRGKRLLAGKSLRKAWFAADRGGDLWYALWTLLSGSPASRVANEIRDNFRHAHETVEGGPSRYYPVDSDSWQKLMADTIRKHVPWSEVEAELKKRFKN